MYTLYDELADWWPLLSRVADYEEEATVYTRELYSASADTPTTLLELGSGGGNNAFHMKEVFDITLVDLSERMLAVSQAINPECRHIQGDMRFVRLGEEFDCVFVHDAVAYMLSLQDLERAIQTAYVHCRRGGAAVFVPDFTTETFRASTSHGGTDGDSRALRYLEWTWDPDPTDNQYTVDYSLLLRELDGSVRCLNERHTEGLFDKDTWLDLLADAGFDSVHKFVRISDQTTDEVPLFVGRK